MAYRDRNYDEFLGKEELEALVVAFEDKLANNESFFYEFGSYERIIEYYEGKFEFDKAHSVVEYALEQHPFSASFLIKKAQFLFEDRQDAQALELLDKAIVLDCSELSIFYLRSEIYTYTGRYDDALEALETALNIADKDEHKDIYIALSEVYEDMESPAETMEYLEYAIEADPFCEDALNRYLYCVDVNMLQYQAIPFLEKMLDKAPYSYVAWFNLGNAYFAIEKYEESIDAYEFAIAIKDDFEIAVRECGDAYFKLELYEKASEYYMDAAQVYEIDDHLCCAIAKCKYALQEINEAIKFLKQAVEMDPHCDEAFFLLGNIFSYEGAYTKAISFYENAIALVPTNHEYLYITAKLYLYIEDHASAEDLFIKAINLDNNPMEYWMGLMDCYMDVEMYPLVKECIEKAIDLIGYNATLYYYEAASNFAMGNTQEGMLCFQQALLEDYPSHTLIFDLLPRLEENKDICAVIEQYGNDEF